MKFTLFLLLCISLLSQDTTYIRSVVETLSSNAMYGRGYAYNGHNVASDFIIKELKKHGVQPGITGYKQFFNVASPIHNTEPKLMIDNTSQVLGQDFLPFFKSGSGSLDTHSIDVGDGDVHKAYQKEIIKDKCILFDEVIANKTIGNSVFERIIFFRELGARAIMVRRKTFTYGVNYGNLNIPVLMIRNDIKISNDTPITINVDIALNRIETQNVIGKIPSESSDSTIIIMGHYDHISAITKNIYFPGANDNASGISLMLDLAKFLKNKTVLHNILFIFFSGEELGLLGSRYFVTQSDLSKLNIKFILNFDMVGSGENGIMVLGGEEFPSEFNIMKQIGAQQNLPRIRKRKNSPISDHFFFLNEGIKGFYIYSLGGKQPYHNINDVASTIQYENIMQIRTLSIAYLKHHKIWESSNE